MAMAVQPGEDIDTLLQRFNTDFAFYAERCLKIKDKTSAHVIPFVFNDAQRYLHKQIQQQYQRLRYVRKIVLKGRQQGISTYVGARYYWRTTGSFGKQAFILTHEDKATNNLFNIVKRYHQHVPIVLKPHTKKSNAKELVFDLLDSGYQVGTARTEGTGRSGTFHFFHGSEMAFWANAHSHFAGLGQTLPLAPDTESILESTANGLGNAFKDTWDLAIRDESDYEAVFIPWYWQSEYQKPVPPNFTMDSEEQDYRDTYDLTLAQMVWRRDKIKTDFRGDVSLFDQEYPATPELAFLRSVRGALISPNLIVRARNTHVEPTGPLIMGVDVAEYGDDKTVFCYRRGRYVYPLEVFSKKDPMQVAGLIAKRLSEGVPILGGMKPNTVNIDVGGPGSGVEARLREQSFEHVYRVNFGEAAVEDEIYANRRAEMWDGVRIWLRDTPCHLPDDDALQADLTAVPPKLGENYTYDSSRRLVLVSKERLRKEGVKSPDRGDALALTFAYNVSNSLGQHDIDPNRTYDWRAGG